MSGVRDGLPDPDLGPLGEAGAYHARIQLDELELPVLPQVALSLLEQLRAEGVGLKTVAETLASDPSLAAAVLRLANTAHFSRGGQEVTSIDRAVIMLGSRTVRSLALSLQLIKAVKRGPAMSGATYAAFWRDAILRGCLAKRLAFHTDASLAEEAYLVGLLQDLGVVVMASHSFATYTPFLEEADGCSKTLYSVEKTYRCLDHASIIAALCRKWSVPALLSLPLARHHIRPPEKAQSEELLRLWQIAYFVGAIPLRIVSRGKQNDELRTIAHRWFRLRDTQLPELLSGAAEDFERVRDVYASVLPPNAGIAALVNQATNFLAAA